MTVPAPTVRYLGAYFGEPWVSGICDEGTQVPVPVGEPCVDCDELIDADQSGSFMGNGVWPDRPVLVPVHKECGLRAVIGGIGHLENHPYWCNLRHQPDGGRTRRQSALEVWEWVHEHGQPTPLEQE